MGYQKVTLQTGFNLVAPQFVAVGGGAINIQDIKLDVPDDEASGGDSIQILDETGNPVVSYFWFPAAWFGGTKSGWFDGDTGGLADLSLNNGLGVLIDSGVDTTVTIAGEVPTNKAENVTVYGFNVVGNSSPVQINIQDIQIDLDDNDATGGDSIQILDETGNPVVSYFWFPAAWFGGTKSGWFDGDTGGLADVTLAPGQGVLLDITVDGLTATVPAAIPAN